MRTTRFAASLSLAILATAPILMAAAPPRSHHPPIPASVSSTSAAPTANATAAAANALLNESSPFALGRGGLAALSKAKMFTFTVVLNGSYNVPAGSTGYIFASMSGGTAPYTYYWQRNGLGMGSGYNSSSSVMPYFCCSGITEYFLVNVTDANGLTAQSNQFFVHVY